MKNYDYNPRVICSSRPLLPHPTGYHRHHWVTNVCIGLKLTTLNAVFQLVDANFLSFIIQAKRFKPKALAYWCRQIVKKLQISSSTICNSFASLLKLKEPKQSELTTAGFKLATYEFYGNHDSHCASRLIVDIRDSLTFCPWALKLGPRLLPWLC